MILSALPNCLCCESRINPHHSARKSSFYDVDYCSTYCRKFVEEGHKMVNGMDKTGHKNMKGLEWWPKLSFDCEVCGDAYEVNKTNSKLLFCSNYCSKALQKNANIRKASNLLATFKMMQHKRKYGNEKGWLSSNSIYEIMKNRGDVAYNSYPSIFKLWASKGLIEVRSINNRMNEYRIAERFITEPIGKFMIQCRPKRNC